MTFAEIMRGLREKAGLTQAALAQKSGVSIRSIQTWEQGQRCPVSADFFRLARALGASADAFAAMSDKAPAGKPRKGK